MVTAAVEGGAVVEVKEVVAMGVVEEEKVVVGI